MIYLKFINFNLLIGCEVAHKILRTDSALSTIKELYQRFRGNDAIRAIRRALIGAIVISVYNNKTYRIDDVDFNSTPASMKFILPERARSELQFKVRLFLWCNTIFRKWKVQMLWRTVTWIFCVPHTVVKSVFQRYASRKSVTDRKNKSFCK